MAEGKVVEDLDMLESALRHAEEGRHVFRLRPRGKKPLKPGWQERATSDPDRVRGLWKARPTANVGMRTGRESGVVVVDVDVALPEDESKAEFWARVEEEDPDALERLEEVRRRMEAIREQYPTGRVYRTGSGGFLLAYQYPSGAESVPNQARVGGRPVDVRGDGGYVVLPPSIHPDTGARYEVEEDGEPGPTAPAFVWEGSRPGDSTEARREAASERGMTVLWTGVSHGGRNDACASLAGSLARRGVPEEEAVEILLAWNLRNEPPIGDHPDDGEPADVEIPRTVASIYRKERQRREREAEEDATPEIRLTRHADYTRKYAIGGGTRWLVRDWIPEQGFGTVVGPPETFKTWMLYDLAYSVATGTDFLGQFPVEEQGPVIVFQLEDSNPDTTRRFNLIEWFRRGWTVPPEQDGDGVLTAPLPLNPPIYHDEQFNVDLEPGTIDQICECVLEVGAKLAIFDPFFTLGDLDDYLAGAAKKLQPLKNRRQELGCGFLFGHHSKKNAEDVDSTERRRTWGSQFLDASKNFDWQVRKLDDAKIGLKRYFKNAATISEVEVSFNINDRPDRGPWAYGVEVQEKSPFGSPLQGGADEALSDEAVRRSLYEFVCAHKGCTASQIREAFDLRAERVIRARDWLEEEGFIENRGSDSAHAWYPTGEPFLGASLTQGGS